VAVLARFAPDAVVRERRGAVPLDVWDSPDPQVVHAYLNDTSHNHDAAGLQWATGQQQIASWAAARFAQQPCAVAGPHRTAGDTVRWTYQEFSDPYQRTPGVGPLEGTAEAVVRGGRITVLTLVFSPESAARRWREMVFSAEQSRARHHAAPSSPFGGGAIGQRHGPRPTGPTAPETSPVAWPLTLGGLAVLASVVAVLRRHRVPQYERSGGPAQGSNWSA
jgi:hypothetical protein